MKNSNSTTKTVGLVVVGALVGAAIGILFAPKKGSETRSLLTGKSDKFSKKWNKKLDKQSKRLNNQMQKDTKYLKNKALEFSDLIDDKFKKEVPKTLPNTNVLLPENNEY